MSGPNGGFLGTLVALSVIGLSLISAALLGWLLLSGVMAAAFRHVKQLVKRGAERRRAERAERDRRRTAA